MFEVGLTELAMIALVALLVLGPEKLPRAARMAGLYVRKARATWHAIRADIERELAAEDMKRAVKDTERTLSAALTPPAPSSMPSAEIPSADTEPKPADSSGSSSTSPE